MDKAIDLKGIHKRLGDRDILRDVTFTVDAGDIFGFLGPNGAGKTTTIRIMLGLLSPSSGDLRVLGRSVDQSETRKRMGFLLDIDGLYDNATARDNLMYYAKIYGVSSPEEAISLVLRRVSLSDRSNDKVSSYSKGMRQRLAFGRALLHNPEVLILDEPTSGVDPTGQMEMRQLILDEARQRGKTVFLSSHNLDEVQRICNRIALIDRGRIKICGDREKLQRQAGKGKLIIETVETVPASVIACISQLPRLIVESQSEKSLVLSLSNGTAASDIVSLLAGQGVRIEQVRHFDASLEDIYASIVKEAAK